MMADWIEVKASEVEVGDTSCSNGVIFGRVRAIEKGTGLDAGKLRIMHDGAPSILVGPDTSIEVYR